MTDTEHTSPDDDLEPLVCPFPAPLDALPEEPLPADGSGVIRMTLNTYDFELAPARTGVVWVYGPPELPDGVYASIFDASVEDEHRAFASPGMIEHWKRTGFYRPHQVYLPITPEDERLVLDRYEAACADVASRQAAWAHWHEIRERIQGDVVTRLETIAVCDDADEETRLYEVVEGTHLRPLAVLARSQFYDFDTPAERAERERAEIAEAAARAARAATVTPRRRRR